MRKIEAIIQPFKLQKVKERLNDAGIQGLTVSEVQGFGHQHGKAVTYRGAECDVALLPKVKLEILAAEDKVAGVVAAIEAAARTGEIGDGKIAVYPLDEVIRIRTGERGRDAI